MKAFSVMALSACTLSLAILSACSSGSSDEGIEARIKALPLAAAHTHEEASAAAGAIPKHSGEEPLSFRRSDGTRIELQLGLLNLVPIELQRCGTPVSLLLQHFADGVSPIGAAYAHGGEDGEAPEGAIDVVEGEETDLGSLVASPGEYCGLVVELQPGADTPAKHGGALDTSLAGASINVAPCHYDAAVGLSDEDAAAVTAHHCVQAKFSGAARRVTLPFTKPVSLNSASRELELTIAVRYEEWFDNIDFAKLETDTAEQARLADNVAGSLQALTGDEQLVNLAFQIKLDGEEAVCGKVYDGLGNGAQRDLRVEGFRYYASDFELQNASGTQAVKLAEKPNATVFQNDAHNVALIGHAQGCDAPVGVRNLAVSGTVKKGDYEKICFLLGVPFELAHSDIATAPSPLNVSGMDWSWLFGRMFFRFDSVADPDGTPANFFVHLGSTGCTNGSSDFGATPDAECAYPNRPKICLDYAEIEEGHPIVADLAAVISEVDIANNTADTAPGCMSFPGDPDCVTVIPKLNLDFPLSPSTLIPRQDQALFTVGE